MTSLAVLLGTNAATAETRLVMFQSDTCQPCRAFVAETLRSYWGSATSLDLPLLMVDRPSLGTAGYPLRARIETLPTFVLMLDGREIDRISGYVDHSGFLAEVERLQRTLTQTTVVASE